MDADCCDAVGESVITSEIDASKTLSYVTQQVFGTSGVGQAQEERARVLSKLDDNGECCFGRASPFNIPSYWLFAWSSSVGSCYAFV